MITKANNLCPFMFFMVWLWFCGLSSSFTAKLSNVVKCEAFSVEL